LAARVFFGSTEQGKKTGKNFLRGLVGIIDG